MAVRPKKHQDIGCENHYSSLSLLRSKIKQSVSFKTKFSYFTIVASVVSW